MSCHRWGRSVRGDGVTVECLGLAGREVDPPDEFVGRVTVVLRPDELDGVGAVRRRIDVVVPIQRVVEVQHPARGVERDDEVVSELLRGDDRGAVGGRRDRLALAVREFGLVGGGSPDRGVQLAVESVGGDDAGGDRRDQTERHDRGAECGGEVEHRREYDRYHYP